MAGNYDGSLKYDTKINTDGFVTGVNKIAKTALLSATSVGAGILSIGIKYNSQMKQYNAGFSTMLGSAEKAKKTMEDLKNFAFKTPFELTDLANASTTLLAFGEDVENLMPDLKMLGDISLGNAEKFKGLALVFGQVKSQGRLMGQDLLQMINQGFNPLQIISEKTGKSVATLKDEMAKGKITFEMVADAMKTATSEGGQFFNAMETQSKTLSGQWSTLKDNVVALTGEITSELSDKLTSTILPKLIDKVEELSEKWEDGTLKNEIANVTTAVAAFGAAVAAMNFAMFLKDIAKLVSGVKNYTAATKAATLAQKAMNSAMLKNPYGLILAAIMAVVAGIITYAATHESAYEKMANTHKKAITDIKDSVNEITESYDKSVKSIRQKADEEIAAAEVAKTYKEELFELDSQLKSGTLTQEEATAVTEDFKLVAGKLEEIIPGITDSLYDETGQINIQEDAVMRLCDAYYELVVAKANATAAEEIITETAKSIVQLKTEKRNAQDKIDEINKEINNIPTTTREVDTNGDGIVDRVETHYSHPLVASQVGHRKSDIKQLEQTQEFADKKIEQLEATRDNTLAILKEENAKVSEILKANPLLSNETGETITSDATQTAKTLETLREKELRDLKHSLAMGKISQQDYYSELAKYRDKYFDEGSAEWQKYTEEIEKYRESSFENYVDVLEKGYEEAIDTIDNLKDKQKSIAENLYDDAALGLSKITIKSGQGIEEYFDVADVGAQNKQLEEYSKLLDELFAKRTELPKEALEQLQSMGVAEGTNFVKAMLRMTDAEWENYSSSLTNRESIAAKISSQLMEDQFEDAKKILEDKFGQLPEDFFGIGEESAEFFGDGFISELSAIMETVRTAITAEMSAMVPAVIANAGGGVGGSISNTYNNFTVASSKSTATESIRALRNYATYTRMSGVWRN